MNIVLIIVIAKFSKEFAQLSATASLPIKSSKGTKPGSIIETEVKKEKNIYSKRIRNWLLLGLKFITVP